MTGLSWTADLDELEVCPPCFHSGTWAHSSHGRGQKLKRDKVKHIRPLTDFVPKGKIDTSMHIPLTKASFLAKPNIKGMEKYIPTIVNITSM